MNNSEGNSPLIQDQKKTVILSAGYCDQKKYVLLLTVQQSVIDPNLSRNLDRKSNYST